MYKVVHNEKEIKEYIKATKQMLTVFKTARKFGLENEFSNIQLKRIIDNMDKNDEYEASTVKGRVLRENILGDKSLDSIADEVNYSTPYVYQVKQKILKEFAAMVFEVILI